MSDQPLTADEEKELAELAARKAAAETKPAEEPAAAEPVAEPTPAEESAEAPVEAPTEKAPAPKLGTAAQKAAQVEMDAPTNVATPVSEQRTVTFVMPGDTPPFRERQATVVAEGFRGRLTLDVQTVLDEDGLKSPFRYRDIEHDPSGRPGTWH